MNHSEGSQTGIETPLHEMISKRLRAHRKRLTKIEKYEQMEGLNQDQIEAVARKPEVTTSIRELEEIEKQLVLFEAELAREKQDQIKAQEQEIKNQVAQANLQRQMNQHIHRIQFALLKPLSRLIGGHVVTEVEFNALAQAKTILTNPTNVQEYIAQAEAIHAQLFHQSPDFFVENITFAHLNQLILRLLTPVPEPKFGLFGKEIDVVETNSLRQVPLENITFLTLETAPNAEPMEEKIVEKKQRNRKKNRKSLPPKATAPVAVE